MKPKKKQISPTKKRNTYKNEKKKRQKKNGNI